MLGHRLRFRKVVSSQLSAIAKDDFALALRYSAPAFRMSNSPDTFRQMVRTGYAGLLKYKALRFAGAKRSTDIAMMPVFVKSESGNEVGYLYILRRDTSKSALKPKNGEKPTRQSPKSSADMSTWYIEGVSPLGGGGYPGAGRPESGRITDVREI